MHRDWVLLKHHEHQVPDQRHHAEDIQLRATQEGRIEEANDHGGLLLQAPDGPPVLLRLL